MTNPIRNQLAPSVNSTRESIQPRAMTPAGSSSSPTTIQPETNTKKELGYIERAVAWVASWIASIFKKVFFCFFPKPEPVPEPASPPDQNDTPVPPAILPPLISEEIQSRVELLDALDRLTDRQKNEIYRAVGLNQSRWYFPGQWLSSYNQIGKNAIQNNPLILREYLRRNA